MATITKREIAERIAKRTDQTQVVTKQIVQLFLDEVVEELAMGNKLEFRDFGIFEVVKRRSRNGRNPRTGEKVFVPAKQVVSFKMGRKMKKVVAGDDDDDAPQEQPTPEAPASGIPGTLGSAAQQTPASGAPASSADATAPSAPGGSPDQAEGRTTL